MPYEKPMAIVIWWMEVVYIHWVMVGNQGSGVKSKMLQGASHRINLRSHHGFLSTTLVHPGHSIWGVRIWMLPVATSPCKVCHRLKASMTRPKHAWPERNGVSCQDFASLCITSRNMLVLGLSAQWLISIRMQFTWMLKIVNLYNY